MSVVIQITMLTVQFEIRLLLNKYERILMKIQDNSATIQETID